MPQFVNGVTSSTKENTMKQKFFVLGAIALIAVVGLFVFEHATSAQRPDRNAQPGQGQRGERPGGDRGNRGTMNMMGPTFNPVSIVENSWIDLSFNVGVDDETLVKARPIYKTTHEKFAMKMKEINEKFEPQMREAFTSSDGDRRAAFQKVQAIREKMDKEKYALVMGGGKEFQTSLKTVLSEEQMTKLNELTKERQVAQRQRTNRFRGGEGEQRRGQGGQRGQRPSQ